MDYRSAMAISASGMAVERTRLDVIALNIANADSTRAGGKLYEPLTVISGPRDALGFERMLALQGWVTQANLPTGVEVREIRPTGAAPRLVYEPGHPDADAKGFVAHPGVNPLREMVGIIAATRAYEANLAALNATRTMAGRALEIGGNP
jgi:flagellar basal-body rod protein FlgC